MTKLRTRASILRLSVMVFLTLGIASTGLMTSMQTAAAASSSANLWAVPVNSRIDDGNFQILRLKFNLDTGNPLDIIRITLDQGTLEEKVLEFNGNGDILTADSAFVSVDGSVKFKTDGYLLSKLSGKFKIAIDKTEMTVGEHDALAEIITTGGETITDDAQFKLRAGSSGEADLVATFFGAPDNVKTDKKYIGFVKEANEGTGNAGKHTISIYLSDDATLDGSDVMVGDEDVNNLKAGKDRMVPVQFELPEGSDTGAAYLIVLVDSDEDVSESNENNNDDKSETINVLAFSDQFPHG